MPPHILAIYGSPRRRGNTAALLDQAVAGAIQTGASAEKIVLRDLKISPCLELYGCKEAGECSIRDDFQPLRDKVLRADGIILASPIFFYAVSGQTKVMMDRFQSLWVKRHWVDPLPVEKTPLSRKGMFISVGATRGNKLFDGANLSVKYFFDCIDTALIKTLGYRGIDFEGDIKRYPEHLEEAFASGRELATALRAKLP